MNDIGGHTDLTEIHRTFHSKTEEYTFSSARGTFSRIGHILAQKTSLNELNKTKIKACIFSNHNAMKQITRTAIKKKKKKTGKDTHRD